MTNFKIKRAVSKGSRSSHGGLLAIRHVLDRYAPLKTLPGEVLQKLFGITCLAVLLAMVFRSVLGGKSLYGFEEEWNKDRYYGVIAGYRKKLTHALLSRNLLRFGTQEVRTLVMGMVKVLHTEGKVTLKRVAIDSTKVLAQGKQYKKTGWAKIKGKYVKGYKLTLAFDLDSRLPLAYIVTPLNVHESQVFIQLLEFIKSHYQHYPDKVVIDRGFYGKVFFSFCTQHGIKFIIPAKHIDAFKKLVNKVTITDFTSFSCGKQIIRLKDTTIALSGYGQLRCVLIAHTTFDEWMPLDVKQKAIWGLLTNDTTILAHNVIRQYKERWQIEVFFRVLKSHLGLEQLPGHDYRIIMSHVGSVLLAYTSLALIASEDLEEKEVLTLAVLEWRATYIAVNTHWSIRGKTVLLTFTKNSWPERHAQTFFVQEG